MEELFKIIEKYPLMSDISNYDRILILQICQNLALLQKDPILESKFSGDLDPNSILYYIREYLQTFRDKDTYCYIINKEEIIGKHKPKYPSKYAQVKSIYDRLSYEHYLSLKEDNIQYVKLNADLDYRDIFDISEPEFDTKPGRMLIFVIIFIILILMFRLY